MRLFELAFPDVINTRQTTRDSCSGTTAGLVWTSWWKCLLLLMQVQLLADSTGSQLTAHLTPKVSNLCLSTWMSPPAGTSMAVTYASPGNVSSESVPRLLRLCCSARTTSAALIGPAAAEHREVSLSWLPFRMAILGMSLAAMRSPTP